ncbi:MAG: ATP-binding protein [Treponema sp.]|nr:ATP-binding protein [Treponema sp.]
MKSIFTKNLLFVSSAVLLVSIYFTLGVLRFANNQYTQINISNLEDSARTLAHFTPPDVFRDTGIAREWAAGLIETAPAYHRITLINSNGRVIFDTDMDAALMENHLDRTELQIAMRQGYGSSRRESPTMGQYYLYSAVLIRDSIGGVAGVLRISREVSGFYSRLLSSTLLFLIGGLVIILSACWGIFYFSRSLSRSVEAKLDSDLQERTQELKHKADEASAESLHREAILNNMFDGLITLDSRLNIIHTNPRFCTIFDCEYDKSVRGKPLLEFSRSLELEEAAQQVLGTGQVHECTIRRYASGNAQHLHVYSAPLDEGVIMVIGDISRLVKLEQIRKDFAANVSHELRTPIQIIQGFAENILDSSLDNSEQIRYFTGIIKKNAKAMEDLTGDLLTLVSLEDESQPRPPMEVHDLLPLIEEAVQMVDGAAKKKDISISASCPSDISLKLYDTLFVQALVNLLDNGIRYSNPGTKIKIKALREEEKVMIEVSDKGIGISAEHLDRIFERFYRVDPSRRKEKDTGDTAGTGLGLSIVRHIALLHQGRAEVESHVGEGSVFRLLFPA